MDFESIENRPLTRKEADDRYAGGWSVCFWILILIVASYLQWDHRSGQIRDLQERVNALEGDAEVEP